MRDDWFSLGQALSPDPQLWAEEQGHEPTLHMLAGGGGR